jgi:methyl-accepting chemotaxis protein
MKKSAVRNNFIFSIGFGLSLGVAFPIIARYFFTFKSPLLMYIYTGGSLCAGVMVGFMSHLIMKHTFIKQLERINRQMDEIIEGKSDLTKTLQVQSDDIIGQTTIRFNRLMESLAETFSQVKMSVQQFREKSNFLGKHVEENSSHIDDIHQELETILQQVSQQYDDAQSAGEASALVSASATDVSSRVNTINSELQQLSAQVGRQDKAVSTVNTAATAFSKSAEIIQQAAGRAKKAADTLAETAARSRGEISVTAESITSITNALDDIRRLGETITDISRQTNLLAMNAAIEASKAGSAGQGFAVVAKEIRKLATRAADSVESTNTLLASVTEQINLAGGQMNAAVDSFETMNGQAAEIQDATGQLSSQADGQTQQAHNIAFEAVSLEEISHTVNQAFSSLAESFAEVTELCSDMSAGADKGVTATERAGTASRNLTVRMERVDTVSSLIQQTQHTVLDTALHCLREVTALAERLKDFRTTRKRLGDLLVEHRVISPEVLQKALAMQKSEKDGPRMIGEILVELGVIEHKQIDRFIKMQFSRTP